MTEPIKPDEVEVKIPNEVIETFNQLIKSNWDGKRACFTLKEVLEISANLMQLPKLYLLDKGYLNIEQLYGKQGWKIVFDNPGYNESYEATFTFSKK